MIDLSSERLSLYSSWETCEEVQMRRIGKKRQHLTGTRCASVPLRDGINDGFPIMEIFNNRSKLFLRVV